MRLQACRGLRALASHDAPVNILQFAILGGTLRLKVSFVFFLFFTYHLTYKME